MSCPTLVAQRPGLSPAGHPAVDQAGVTCPARVRPDAETLHDAGTETLEQDVRPFRELEEQRHTGGMLEVDADRTLAAFEQVPDGPGRLGVGPPPTDARRAARRPRGRPAPCRRTGTVRCPASSTTRRPSSGPLTMRFRRPASPRRPLRCGPGSRRSSGRRAGRQVVSHPLDDEQLRAPGIARAVA